MADLVQHDDADLQAAHVRGGAIDAAGMFHFPACTSAPVGSGREED